jgi:predicted GNAT family acetyltransferase
MAKPDIRILQPGDEAALEAFLQPRLEFSMFLVGNMRAAGLQDRGQPYQGVYAAAWQGERIVAVAALYWNGNLVLQAPVHLGALCRAALDASGRSLAGVIGPGEQVAEAVQALGLTKAETQLDESEYLYVLDLADLIVPQALQTGRVRGRRMEARDLDQVTAWRVDFGLESLGETPGPDLQARTRASVERSLAKGHIWVLEMGGRLVATSAFNTAIAEAVQVGGVWTPPAWRSRGYGRAVVAASLLDARAEGASLGILFTGEGNVPARRAYTALGFRRVGDYRLLLLKK